VPPGPSPDPEPAPAETELVLDEPAGQAIAGAAEFLRRRGLRLTLQTPYSVAFAATADGAPAGGGQVAAVPVQLKPEWCRLWVTVSGTGPAAAAAAAFVAGLRERDGRARPVVRELEGAIYAPARWPEYAATLSASLRKQGLPAAAIEARLARFRQRWDALGKKAAGAPDGPPAAPPAARPEAQPAGEDEAD
jgi:hypothetical protein